MGRLTAWSGFLGAWLLVAGPLFQGSVELHLIEVSTRKSGVRLPSKWWWLASPVMYFLSRRRIDQGEDDEQSRLFRATGTGWFVVAIGAALLAAKETWELSVILGWSTLSFVLIDLVMLAVVTANTAVRMIAERERT